MLLGKAKSAWPPKTAAVAAALFLALGAGAAKAAPLSFALVDGSLQRVDLPNFSDPSPGARWSGESRIGSVAPGPGGSSVFTPSFDEYRSIAFSRTGQLLAVTGDGRLQGLAPPPFTAPGQTTLIAAESRIGSVSSGPMGSTVFTPSFDDYRSIAFSPGGDLVALTAEGELQRLAPSALAGPGETTVILGESRIGSVSPGPGGSSVFTPSFDEYRSIAFSPTGQLLALTDDGELQLLNLSAMSGTGETTTIAGESRIGAFSLGPGGSSVFAPSFDDYRALAFTPAGDLLALTNDVLQLLVPPAFAEPGQVTLIAGEAPIAFRVFLPSTGPIFVPTGDIYLGFASYEATPNGGGGNNGGGSEPVFVPAPAAATILAVGLLGLGGLRYRAAGPSGRERRAALPA